MTRELVVRNRQRRWRVDVRRLTALIEEFLESDLGLREWEFGVHLVSARAMAGINERWLRHEGSTDVITFDHRENPDAPLHGEAFISLDDAAAQAREFGTSPARELVRYVVHAVLHLLGHDDLDPVRRRRMKREEDRCVRRLEARGRHRALLRAAAPRPAARASAPVSTPRSRRANG